jgi:hypothetical protein
LRDYALHKPGLCFYPQMAQTTADKKKNLRESVKSADTLVKDMIPAFFRPTGIGATTA